MRTAHPSPKEGRRSRRHFRVNRRCLASAADKVHRALLERNRNAADQNHQPRKRAPPAVRCPAAGRSPRRRPAGRLPGSPRRRRRARSGAGGRAPELGQDHNRAGFGRSPPALCLVVCAVRRVASGRTAGDPPGDQPSGSARVVRGWQLSTFNRRDVATSCAHDGRPRAKTMQVNLEQTGVCGRARRMMKWTTTVWVRCPRSVVHGQPGESAW